MTDQIVTLKSGASVLSFSPENGKIISFTDGKKEYISEQISVFKIAFRTKDGDQCFEEACEMKLSSHSLTDASISAKYDGKFCSAEMTVTKNAAEFSWAISITPQSELTAEWVNYPQIAIPNDLSPNSYRILWGFNEGVLVSDINERESLFRYTEPTYPSTGVMGIYPAIVETQFMAYTNGANGLYLGAHDVTDSLKGIDFRKLGENSILLQFKHFCGCQMGEEYRSAYPMILKAFKGDWTDAADIYRDWFDIAKKQAFTPIAENTKLPKWYGDSPVIITYPVRGTHDTDIMTPNAMFPYINAIKHVERLEKELDSKIMVLLMHWEGTAPWAPPYVWPPFGGEEELKRFTHALHERGDVIGVYCSGIGWTLKSNVAEYDTLGRFAEEKLKELMCLSPKQELPYSKICTAQRVGYDMCPTRDFTSATVKHEVEKMVSAGIDYIQLLDQNHGGTPYFCYGKNHGHPPIPGKWQVDAMKKLLHDVNEIGNETLFGCESAAAEAYVPYLLFSDNRYELNYAVGVQVPLYAYLFHEYLNNFMGNQVCVGDIFDHDASPDNIYERIAYSFSAGDMITLVLNQYGNIEWNWGKTRASVHPNQENVKTLVRNLNSWRRGIGKKYLHVGRMVKPIEIICGTNEYKRCDSTYVIRRSKLHTTAWLSRENTFGQFVINYNPSAETFEAELPSDGFKLILSDGSSKALPNGKISITVAPFSAVLIERNA